ncbi:MAG: hypothetical protein CVV30_02385 [Methanomicrobiales archaeon HGW-Methanomicrobiales-1]|jgi:hypothetical protein|nr:MAG: hypothetical protein CVV30_02385 [Methanomicrobiales archaeon HGW-Methanomicrobiales-1]
MRYIAVFGVIILILLLVMGSVTTDTDEDHAKIIALELGIHKNGVALESVEIKYGHPPNLGLQNGNFTAILRALDGTSLFTFDVWDPRYQVDEYGIRDELELHEQMEDPDLEKVYRDMGETSDIDLYLFIPYCRDIQTVDLVDRSSGNLLISVNISPARDTFRNRFPRDPDMMAETRSTPPVTGPVTGKQSPMPIAASILAVILTIILFYRVRR